MERATRDAVDKAPKCSSGKGYPAQSERLSHRAGATSKDPGISIRFQVRETPERFPEEQ